MFQPCSSVSTVTFEHVILSWVYEGTTWFYAKSDDNVKLEVEKDTKLIAIDPYSCVIKDTDSYSIK